MTLSEIIAYMQQMQRVFGDLEAYIRNEDGTISQFEAAVMHDTNFPNEHYFVISEEIPNGQWLRVVK